MPDRLPSPMDVAHWPADIREKRQGYCTAQCQASMKLTDFLKGMLSPRGQRKAIELLYKFTDARDKLLWLNGYMACIDFVYGKGEETQIPNPYAAMVPAVVPDDMACDVATASGAIIVEIRQLETA